MTAIQIADLNNGKVDVDHVATWANSTALSATDRMGRSKRTLAGIDALALDRMSANDLLAFQQRQVIDFNAKALLASLGYQVPVPYEAGLSMTTPSQTVEHDGSTYAPIQSELPFTTSGVFESSKFRLIQGVSGADLAATYGSLMIGYIQSGVGAIARTVLVKLLELAVSAEEFGAVGDGVTDDSPALQKAATALAARGAGTILLQPGKTYQLATEVAVAARIVIQGGGARVRTGVNHAFAITAPIEVYGLEFVSTATGSTIPAAVYGVANGLGGTRIDGCKIGRLAIIVRDGLANSSASNRSVRILNCTFDGNYTGGTGLDTTNVLDLRGANDIHVDGCDMDVVGVERLVKISDSSRRIFIRGNTFRCVSTTIGKQCIDLFADSREVIVEGNTADLNGFTAFVENKNGEGNTEYAEPSEVLVRGNLLKFAGASASLSPIAIYGAWGLAAGTLARSTVKVNGNDILIQGTGTLNAPIVVRGVTHADVTGNTVWRDDNPNFAPGLEVSNCKRIIIANNEIEHGHVLIGLAAQHPGGTTYSQPPVDARVEGNIISSFGSQGGVMVIGAGTLSRLAVGNNTLIPKAGTGSSGVVQINASTVDSLSVVGNQGFSLTNADILLASGGTVTTYHMTGNAWQWGQTVSNPGTIANNSQFSLNVTVKGAAVGDTVAVGLPYTSQGAGVEARVSSGNNVQITLRNRTGNDLTFASGTFTARVSRG